MSKNTWTYFVIGLIVVAAGGGAYFYITHSASEVTIPVSITAPQASPPTSSQDEDVRRQTLEGIGSIKNLKPVPIQPGPQK